MSEREIIDGSGLGTTNSAIADLEDGRPRLVELIGPVLSKTWPKSVTIDTGEVETSFDLAHARQRAGLADRHPRERPRHRAGPRRRGAVETERPPEKYEMSRS